MKKQTLHSIFTFVFLLGLVACETKDQSPLSAPQNEEKTTHQPHTSTDNTDATNDPAKGKSAEALKILLSVGFFKLTDVKIPEKIRQTKDSIFKLFIPVFASDKNYSGYDLTDSKNMGKIEQALAAKLSDPSDQREQQVLKATIENCKQRKLEKECPVIPGFAEATAFTLDNGDNISLWTNAHVVARALGTLAKIRGSSEESLIKDKSKLIIFVFNDKNEMVVNPYIDPPTIKREPLRTRAAQQKNSFFAEDCDYFELALAKPISKGLHLASRSFIEGDIVYSIGFPYCTNCDLSSFDIGVTDTYDRGNDNSDGKSLLVTRGVVLTKKPNRDSLYDWNKIIQTSNDGQHGMSGAPMLNEDGEVIGIYRGGKGKIVEANYFRISDFVVMP